MKAHSPNQITQTFCCMYSYSFVFTYFREYNLSGYCTVYPLGDNQSSYLYGSSTGFSLTCYNNTSEWLLLSVDDNNFNVNNAQISSELFDLHTEEVTHFESAADIFLKYCNINLVTFF